MSMMVSFVLSFFPRDVLDEILNLIESVSEDFPSYFYTLVAETIDFPITLSYLRENMILSSTTKISDRSLTAIFIL